MTASQICKNEVAKAIVSGVVLLPVLEAPDYLSKVSANENQVMLGALFYFIMAAAGACIGPMYPILRKQNEALALGAVDFRMIEGVIFMVGVRCILSLVSVSQEFVQAGAPQSSYIKL